MKINEKIKLFGQGVKIEESGEYQITFLKTGNSFVRNYKKDETVIFVKELGEVELKFVKTEEENG